MSQSEITQEEGSPKTNRANTPEKGLTEQIKQVTQSDEIDLRALWATFVGFLRKAIKVAIKRGIILAIFLLAGGVWGYYRHQTSAPVYKTRMLIDAKVTDYSILSGLIGTLQDLADEQNYAGIESVLSIKPDVAKTIISVKAVDKLVVFKDLSAQQNKEFKTKEKDQKSAKERDKEIFQLKGQKFAIEVSLNNNNNFPALEKALTSYLRDNEYIKKRVELKKEFLTQKKAKISKEIGDLDSLKKNISNIFTRKNQNIQITDPGTISKLYRESVKLREEELKIDTTLALIDNIQVVEGFVKFNTPSVKVTKRIKVGLYISFALWLMLVLWLDVRKPFMKFLNEDKNKSK